jgi:F-type H+-transporting ATPase subunit b
MVIDGFTMGMQVLNFLILVWLMRRFLYKPVLRAIDEREKRIASRLAGAEAGKAEALKESESFRQKNEAFEQARTALLNKARADADAERLRLFGQAREAAEAFSLKHRETMESDMRNLHDAIRLRIQKDVLAIARKVLKDLAGESLEAHLTEAFIRRLHDLDGPSKALVADALNQGPGSVLVQSAFDLSQDQRRLIQEAMDEAFPAAGMARFRTDPALIGGIELTVHGRKMAWSISDYLGSLEQGVEELLNGKDREETGSR